MSISSEVIISTLKRMWKLLAAKTTKRNSDLGEGLFLSPFHPLLLSNRLFLRSGQHSQKSNSHSFSMVKMFKSCRGRNSSPVTLLFVHYLFDFIFYYFEGRLKLDSFFVHCLDRQGTFTNFRDGFWRFVILYLWRK